MSPSSTSAIEVRDLVFSYPDGRVPIFSGLTFALAAGARCLLLGANGVGKSTLLRLVAGRHMIPPDMVRVLGRPAFEDTRLSGEVGFLGGPFPFAADIRVSEILVRRAGIDPRRRARVLEILDVDPGWRMHQVSDGQRRRVQILLDLERTLSVILLDEVTAELDVLARADLMAFLREESITRAVTIVYASHVLDGLGEFATDVLFLSPGRSRRNPGSVPSTSRDDSAGQSPAPPTRLRARMPIAEALQLGAGLAGAGASPLHRLCEHWMREDRGAAKSGAANSGESPGPLR